MAFQRACDLCGFARQTMIGGRLVSAVTRYGLTRQVRRPDGKMRSGRQQSVAYTKQSAGGLDLCNECREKATAVLRSPECCKCGFTRDTRARFSLTSYAQGKTTRKTPPRRRWGALTLCGECWARLAKPNMRPELRGKTGPAKYRGSVTRPAAAVA